MPFFLHFNPVKYPQKILSLYEIFFIFTQGKGLTLNRIKNGLRVKEKTLLWV